LELDVCSSDLLLATYRPTMVNGEVVLLAADGKREMINLTQSGYGDSSPKWVNEGKQMLWFSNRDGLKSMAASGSSQDDVFTRFFSQEEWDKFNLNKDDYTLMEAIAKKEKEVKEGEKTEDQKVKKEDKKVAEVAIDWDGLRERKSKLTIHS